MNMHLFKCRSGLLNFSWLLGFLLILVSCTQPNESDPIVSYENAEEEILAMERSALDQWAMGNPIGFMKNFADDVTYFDDIGAHSRIEGTEAMRTYLSTLEGVIPPHHYKLENPKVQVYGDVGILTTHYVARTTENEPLPLWKATSVYRWVDGDWQMVHANWSLVKTPDETESPA